MTKPPDFEGALKAALEVCKHTGPPFRYKVLDADTGQCVAITLTKWSAFRAAEAIGRNLKPPAEMSVYNMDGQLVVEDD